MSRPLEFMEPHTAEWHREAGKLAREFCPPINPCQDCGAPVVRGYCCTRCRSANPEGM